MISPFKLIIFIIVTAYLFWVSRSSLRDYKTHGFYRFFMWEAILVLVLLNLEYWFEKPFSLYQIVSWFLLSVSVIIVICGTVQLYRKGKPDNKRNDTTLLGIEKTSTLVTTGIYRYIRHPIYSSVFYGAWGIFFKYPSWPNLILAGITISFLLITAKIEEAENIRFFSSAYQSYIKRSKMIIPFLY